MGHPIIAAASLILLALHFCGRGSIDPLFKTDVTFIRLKGPSLLIRQARERVLRATRANKNGQTARGGGGKRKEDAMEMISRRCLMEAKERSMMMYYNDRSIASR
jgi:hypothetical protein